MSLVQHSGNYVFRVSEPSTSTSVGFSIGMLVNAEAYDSLKINHNFDVKETTIIYGDSKEFWKIDGLIKEYMSNQ